MDLRGKNALPEGLGFSLALDVTAMTNFVNLSDEMKSEVVDYIQAASTGEEAKYRVNQVVNNLKQGKSVFFDPMHETFH